MADPIHQSHSRATKMTSRPVSNKTRTRMPVPDHGEMRERAFIHQVLVSPMVRVDGPLRSAGCSFMISDPAQIPNAGWGNLRNHKDERSAANDVPFRIHMTSASIRTPNSDPD